MKFIWKSMASVMFVFLLLVGCSTETDNQTEGKLVVVATTGMIGDLAQNIGGEHVEVTSLMGPGVDPHLYKATQGDVKTLDGADMILYNGLHLEGKMEEIFEQMGKQKTTIAVSKDIAKEELHEVQAGQYDPHIWFDVTLWMQAADTVNEALIKEDPANKESYQKNYEAYIEKLKELNEYVQSEINTIPESQRVLVTAHDAFGYFGAAYGLEVKGLQGMNTVSEYGSKDVTDLRDYLVEKQIKAIFVETSVPKKAIEAVIQGAEKQGHTVKIGGELFSDAMGEKGTEKGTYLGMVRHNTDTIVNALK
ncbi:metal ABC transporter solute-binding protein, Zn/Mn family [Peribacillus asahii]|uniref:metal ABC transporter solute-binding protein, Zn/Mn family n=1 Tax=Peribacillus asahii TaxID=228899 RepID=UPI00207AE084|nr:zinc ABC transporter substrate-binding protein [Peribacillus asahii]